MKIEFLNDISYGGRFPHADPNQLVRLWILDGWNNNRIKEVVDEVFAYDWVDGNPTFPDRQKLFGHLVKLILSL